MLEETRANGEAKGWSVVFEFHKPIWTDIYGIHRNGCGGDGLGTPLDVSGHRMTGVSAMGPTTRRHCRGTESKENVNPAGIHHAASQ